MKKYWDKIVNFVALIAFFVAGLVIVNGTTVLGEDKSAYLPVHEFYPIFAVALCAFIFILVFNIIRKTYKPNYLLVGVFGALFLIDLLVVISFKNRVFTFPLLNEVEEGIFVFGPDTNWFESNITASLKAMFILEYLILLMTTFSIIDIIPKIFDGMKLVALACLIILGIASFCVIFSYITEASLYPEFIKHLKDGDQVIYQVKSIYHDKSSYGVILFLALIASLFLHIYKKQWWWFIPAGFFYLNLIFVWDKSSLAFGMVIIISYLITRFFVSFKEHKKRNIIAASIIGGLFLAGIIGFVVAGIINPRIFEVVTSSVSTKGYSTLATRSWVWAKMKLILSEGSPLFGLGYALWRYLLFYYNTYDPVNAIPNNHNDAHNGYYELLGTGGIVLLIVFLLLCGYLVYVGIKHFKENKTLVVFSFTVLTVMFAYMLIASGTPLFSRTLDYSILGMIIFVPLLSIHYKEKAEN